jgi:ATP-dependent Zn protease
MLETLHMHNSIESQLLEQCDPDDKAVLEAALAAHPLLERTAFHEAGHAVARMLMGRKVQRVWIDEAGNGECVYVPSSIRPEEQLYTDPDVLYNLVKGTLAGPLAESLLLFGEDEYMLMQCELSGEDMRNARSLVAEIETSKERRSRRCLHPDEPTQVNDSKLADRIDLSFGQEWNNTLAMLTTPTHWRAVEKIARALIQRRSLSGRTVHNIFQETKKPKKRS